MYIAQLNLHNFKSFGKDHELPLHQGFTAIVGPNGSGKSNLLDALRWVLGENNPSRLRITRQSDLIFQGSISLSQASRAGVRILLRDEGRTCTLARKVDSGGGTVEIDRASGRLGDLDEVKRQWHLEGERFAFIGQGEVAEIVRQRPRERRFHLEALFGIDLYRKRRDDAAARLEDALGELRNLDILLSELRGRRDLLLPEAEAARKARGLMAELEEERRRFYWLRRSDLEASLLDVEALRERQRKSDRLLERWILGWEHFVRRRQGEFEDLRHRWGASEELLTSRGSRMEALKRRIAGTGAGCARTREQILRWEAEQQGFARELALLEAEEEAQRKELQILLREEETLCAEHEAARKALEGRMEHLDAVTREGAALRKELGALQGEDGALRGALRGLGKRHRKVQALWKEEHRLLGEEETSLEEGVRREKSLEKRAHEAGVRHGDAYALYQGALGDFRREEGLLREARGRVQDLKDRLQGEIYPRPVQHLLSACRLGRLRAEPVPAAETFEIPGEYARGIEAYLGGRLFWLFVKHLEEARSCIEQLRSQGRGRATFLPLEQARPRRPHRNVSLPSSGVVGWAAELITPDTAWEPCVMHLLGDLLLVEEYDLGASLARKRLSFPLVTLEGDVFLPSGTVSGGSTRSREGAVALRQALGAAEREAETHRRAVKDLEWEVREAEDHEKEAAREKEERAREARECREETDRTRETLETRRRRFQSVSEEYDEILALLKEKGKGLRDLGLRRAALETRLEELPQITEELEEERRVLDLQNALALGEERRKNSASLLETREKALRAAREKGDTRRSEREHLEEQLRREKEELSELGARYHGLWEERNHCEASRKEDHRAIERLEKKLERGRSKLEAAKSRREELERACLQTENRKNEMDRELEDLISLWEEQFPYECAPEEDVSSEEDHQSLRKIIRDLERKLRGLGDINLGALSEVDSLEERMGFLEEQTGDVRKGAEEMRRFIRETDQYAGTLFSKALEDIDQRFNGLFQRLFGGGEAHLSFRGSGDGEKGSEEDLWDAGVDVVARPPGKQPQHLGQLSGGEQSLTGIALLFAAMEIAGVPLAVLDEVDAALDEVNLQRFARLAQEYSQRLQMIVMTHRRYTMEKAGLLYGVTMSEPGLSQVVGVRMEDWE